MPPPVDVVAARRTADGIALSFSDGHGRLVHPVWLRDTCGCPACRDAATGRRAEESMRFGVDLEPSSITLADDGASVRVTWPDGHVTTATAASLREPTDVAAGTDRLPPDLWGAELAERVPTFDYPDVMADPAAMLSWLEAVDRFGVALLTGTPTDRDTLTELAHRVGPTRPSNYGIDWEIEATATPRSVVYSARGLTAHTDLPYRESPPGLQLLLCDVADAPGGASMLTDGYRVAEALRAERPDLWHTLTTVDVTFRYVDDAHDLRWSAPVVTLHGDGTYGVIRHAPGLIAPFDPDPHTFGPLWSAIHRFTELLSDPRFEVRRRLEPGELLTFDNHRVLHGREAFDLGPGGRRHLLGCYLDTDDLRSRIRLLRAELA